MSRKARTRNSYLSNANAQLMISMLFSSQLVRAFEMGASERGLVGLGVRGVCGSAADVLLSPYQLPIPNITFRLGAQEPSLWKISHWMFPCVLPNPNSSLFWGSSVPSQLSPWQAHGPFSGALSKLFTRLPGLPPLGVSPSLPSLLAC